MVKNSSYASQRLTKAFINKQTKRARLQIIAFFYVWECRKNNNMI